MKFPTKQRMARLVGAALLGLGMGQSALADDFDTLRERWVTHLTGGQDVYDKRNDADLAPLLQSKSDSASVQWTAMVKTDPRIYLWNDLVVDNASAGYEKIITKNFDRLLALAIQYSTPSSPLYHDAALGNGIRSGIVWMCNNYYNKTTLEQGNWWHWQIGAPKSLVKAAILVSDTLSPQDVLLITEAIDRFIPDPGFKTHPSGVGFVQYNEEDKAETAANRADKAAIVLQRGILGRSPAHIVLGRDTFNDIFPHVTEGDGFYADGSYVQHSTVPYTASYGVVTLTNVAELRYLLAHTAWESTAPGAENVVKWVPEVYTPFMYNGAMMDMQGGRKVARQNSSDHGDGRNAVLEFALLANSMPPAEQAQIKSVIKGVVQRDQYFSNYYFGGSLHELSLVKSIMEDPGIVPAAEASKTWVYAPMDRAILRRPDFAVGIAMSSRDRMAAWEQGNGENTKGWWTGLGMTYLYNGDQRHYADNYWPTVDYLRLPGTTTDHSVTTVTPMQWPHLFNWSRMVGGANLGGRSSVVAMELNTGTLTPGTVNKTVVTGSMLTGKKAWFLFGDKVVAVGSDIQSGDANNTIVETIVENRRIGSDGLETLTINDQPKEPMAPWSETVAGTSWAHLAGAVAGSDIGYYFPDAPAVTALSERRGGSWSNIMNGASQEVFYNNYISLAIDHGAKPSNGQYSYVLLPNRSAAQTKSFAADPSVAVLSRTPYVTAVRDSELNMTGSVFWSDTTTKSVSYCGRTHIKSDRKSAVLVQRNGSDLEVSVADPTQIYNGVINVEIGYQALPAGHVLDPNVTIVQTSPSIILAVDVTGALGKSSLAKIKLAPSVLTLEPSDDSYVRNGPYSAISYGTAATIPVKKTTADGFERKGLMKFDLSCVDGEIESATLSLGAATVSQAGAMTNVARALDSHWAQSSVKLTTMPTPGAQLASWDVPAQGGMVQVDMTSAVNAAMTGNRKLSFDIEAAADYGAGLVEYAARENATTNLRPTLTVRVR